MNRLGVIEAGLAPRWTFQGPGAEDRRPESLALAIGQGRVVSHGFLFVLILAAAIYLGMSARNLSSSHPVPSLAWNETAYSVYSDGLVLRPAVQTDSPFASIQAGAETGADVVAKENEAATAMDLLAMAEAALAAGGQQASDLAKASAPEEREILTYQVARGDTVSAIAERFKISAETVLSANNLRPTELIRIGQALLILPVTGVLHTVEKGDSLLYLASRYGVSTEDIVGFKANHIPSADTLPIGQKLVIPNGSVPVARESSSTRGGTRAAADPAPAQAAPAPSAGGAASGQFIWPNPGIITQYFTSYHDGLDIATAYGTPIAAADAGVVVGREALGWGLGLNVTVDHGNGYSTTYAHMSSFSVGVGDRVAKGDMVGRIGSTGNSTGPHNHFIVRRNGVPINPLNVLP